MTLRDFLLHQTKVGELCVIRNAGWIVAVAYIDHEDLFIVPEQLAEHEVAGDSWGTLNVTTESGEQAGAPCHYIDV